MGFRRASVHDTGVESAFAMLQEISAAEARAAAQADELERVRSELQHALRNGK